MILAPVQLHLQEIVFGRDQHLIPIGLSGVFGRGEQVVGGAHAVLAGRAGFIEEGDPAVRGWAGGRVRGLCNIRGEGRQHRIHQQGEQYEFAINDQGVITELVHTHGRTTPWSASDSSAPKSQQIPQRTDLPVRVNSDIQVKSQ